MDSQPAMRRIRHQTTWPTLAVWFLTTLAALACRYSVRDTGFVDLGAEPYRLVLDIPAASKSQLPANVPVAAARSLEESNIEWSFQTNPDASAQPTLSLRDSNGRSLELGRGTDLLGNPDALLKRVQATTTSPRREELLGETLQAYAVLVLVEGTDTEETARVRRITEGASGTIQRLMPSMPKPVDTPPRLISIPLAQQAAEAVLIWGLGFDPKPTSEARLAIVYGRGRRLGSTLEGPTITRTALQERLALIGQDCECDLDRAWLKGPVLPGRWSRDLQQTASRLLGFDPENPLVRTEVSRIVLRGEGDRTRARKPTTVLGLGYAEESVDATDTETVGAGDSNSGDSKLITATNGVTRAQPGGATQDSLRPDTNSVPVTGTAPPQTGPIWIALGGAFGISVLAGVWVAAKSSRKHG